MNTMIHKQYICIAAMMVLRLLVEKSDFDDSTDECKRDIPMFDVGLYLL